MQQVPSHLIKARLIVGLIVLWMPSFAHAFTVHADTPHSTLGLHLKYFEDKTANLTYKDILLIPSDQFIQSQAETPNIGLTGSAYWFAVELENPSNIPLERLLQIAYAQLDSIALYWPSQRDEFQVMQAGDSLPFAQRPINHRTFLFPLELEAESTTRFLMRVKTNGSLQLPISLWEERAFFENDQEELLVFGAFFGIALIMAIYNLFIYFMLREVSHLYYVLSVLSAAAFLANYLGFSYQYLWPNSPYWAQASLLFFFGGFCCFACLLPIHLLELKESFPRISNLLRLIAIATGGLAFASFFAPFNIILKLFVPLSLVGDAIFATIGYVRWGQGFPPARSYSLAWTFFLLGGFVFGLKVLGVVPRTFFTEYGSTIGIVLQLTLLSWALAVRLKTLQDQKTEHLVRATHLSQELAIAESLVLGRQMNPHFLSNQLNDATYLVEDDPQRAIEQLEDLAEFYRVLMTYCTKPIVPIHEERVVLEQYLSINREEYERHNIKLDFDLEDSVLVPSMMIQPLIENAIKHGMELKRDGCEIRGFVRRDGPLIAIEICDNGAGSANMDSSTFFKPGHALHNIRERLRLLYGGGGEIAIRDQKGGGLSILLKFPPEPSFREEQAAEKLQISTG